MNQKKVKKKVQKAWHWIWHSDSPISWVVALLVIFIIVKYLFFPGLSLLMGTSLPVAGVESSSMDHNPTKYCEIAATFGGCAQMSSNYRLCDRDFAKKEKMSFNNYWAVCGDWYEKKEITKDNFSKFPMKSGFKKGDIIIVWGRFKPKVGDIIIFNANPESLAPRPIIHRIIEITDEGVIKTKGDHNKDYLTKDNNDYKTDETEIYPEQIIGKAVFKIPYLGWFKIWFVELISKVFDVFF
ncbi:hypothetical protein GOV14_01145 [Candidatus Pacearchaeota archaeon]|nr:hypothetical protein [Candidatus Pacearchaeota archaeon]